ncbi:MAG: hypothetical protein AB1410_02415 [Acidobacteriota bacterium]
MVELKKRETNFQTGFSKIDITPSQPLPLAGHIARKGLSKGVLNPLQGKSFLIKDSGEIVAIVVLELLYISKNWCTEVKRYISKKTGIKKENILISATHTHAGPEIINPDSGKRVSLYFHELKEKILKLILDSLSDFEESILYFGKQGIKGLAGNRYNLKKEESGEISIIKSENKKGFIKGIFICYGCHPTILGAENYKFSGDLFGYAQEKLENILSGQPVVLIANGAGADVSTRFTRKEQSYTELKRLGNILMENIIKSADKLPILENSGLNVETKNLKFKTKRLPLLDYAKSVLKRTKNEFKVERRRVLSEGEMRIWITKLEGLKTLIKSTKEMKYYPEYVTGEIQIIQLGEIAIIGIPGEVFQKTEKEILENVSRLKGVIVGYCNDYLGYFVPSEEWEELKYESLVSILDSSAETKMRKEIIRILNS